MQIERKLRVNMTVHAAVLRMKCKQMVKPAVNAAVRNAPNGKKRGETRFPG